MAKKQKVNKSQAVRDYVRENRKATNQEVADALTKKGIKVTANYVATLKSQAKRKQQARKAAVATPAAVAAVAASEPAAAPAEKKADTVALEHVKAVARTVQSMGGFDRLNELLGVIREVGGLKKFKDLSEAIAGPKEDKIPF